MEHMPMWCPPTPPTTDHDVYVDYSLSLLYDNTPMTEAQLPPVYAKKDNKRSRIDAGLSDRDGRRPAKIRHKDDSVYAPRSLFDRPSQAITKMRRDMKLHKYRPMARPAVATAGGVKPQQPTKPAPEPEPVLEWMIHEDHALLQAIQIYQGLPLNLMIVSPGHSANWDLVADIVNNTSRIYRSPKQCKVRYEAIIVPREEGKLLYDVTPKKQKKQKGSVYKLPQIAEQQSKTNRPMRTSQLFNQDKNTSFTATCNQRYDNIKMVLSRRPPTTRHSTTNATARNPKHAVVLAECAIQYDVPLSPLEVATRRAERLAKEKLKNAVSTSITAEQQQQATARLAQQIIGQQGQAAASTSTQGNQIGQGATAVATTPTGIRTINAATVAVSSPTIVATNVKTARAVGAQGPTIVANLQPGQRITAANLVASNAAVIGQKNIVSYAVSPASKNLTPAQIQMARQQQLARQQAQLKALQQAQASGQKVAVAVSPSAAAIAQQRGATLMKQAAAGTMAGTSAAAQAQAAAGKQNVTTRQVSESEMAALLKRQQLQQQSKALTQVQVPGQAGITAAQVYAQTAAGLQVQQAGTSGTTGIPMTLVKTAGTVTGVRAATQQIRQLHVNQQILAQRRLASGQKVTQLAQVAGKGGVPTQLIVQQKGGLPSTMMVQQLQQVMKQVPGSSLQQFAHVSAGQAVAQPGQVVLAKSPIQTRVIPVSSGALKQTIQVVTASTAQQLRQASQGKPVVTTARASPGPSTVRLQTIPQQAHIQQVSQQQIQQQQQSQQNQQQTQQSQADSQPK